MGKLKHNAVVLLRCESTGQNLRIHEDGHVDGHGAQGELAQFLVHREKSNNTVRFQNAHNPNHWLRITKDHELNGKGIGGEWCVFRIHKHENYKHEQIISLESVALSGEFVGILPEGKVKASNQTKTGPHGSFKVIPFNKHKGDYYIISEHSGHVLDVEGGNINAGTKVILWHKKPWSEAINQKWIFTDDHFIATAANPNLVLDIEGGGARGTKLIIWHKKALHDAWNQRWHMNEHGMIENMQNKHLVLDVEGGSKNPGTKLIVWEPKLGGDNANQRWKLSH